MLTLSTIQSSLPLAQLLAQQNTVLSLTGTVLSELNDSLTKPLSEIHKEGLEGDCNDFIHALKDASRYHDPQGIYPHDEAMNNAVEGISKVLEFNINLVRNTINPQVAELVDGIKELHQNLAELRVKVIDTSSSSPTLESGLLEEISERYKETQYSDLKLNFKIPRPDDISSYLSTGNPHYDAGIASTIQSLGEDEVLCLWDKLFIEGKSRLETIFDINNVNDQALMVIGFVMVQQVKSNLPPGINGDLDDVNDYLVSLQSQLGRLIAVSLRKRLINQNVGKVIVDVNKDEVLVNPDTYTSYQEGGGSDEAILGAVVSGESISTVSEISGDKDRLEKIYATHQRVLAETRQAESIRVGIEYLTKKFYEILNTLPDEVITSFYQNNKGALQARVNDQLRLIGSDLIDDTWNTVRRALCRSVYAHTDALQILEDIDREQASLPDCELLEVAFYAIVNYLARWLGEKIVISKAM